MVPPDLFRLSETGQTIRHLAFSIGIPLLAILLFIIIRARFRGEQLSSSMISAEAHRLRCVIVAETCFLIGALREHRESEQRERS